MPKKTTKPQEMIDMYAIENSLKDEGYTLICGVDEAGRGPLAGPVVAAAVILDESVHIEGVNDSKKLSEKKRDALYPVIMEKAKAFGIGVATEAEIDEHNILQATFLAMRRAVAALQIHPDVAMVDGNRDPLLGIPTITVIKGDSHSASIAAASILAKVYRDELMKKLDAEYPQYLLSQHKGYPTKLHYECILEHGISPIHRRSFLKKLIAEYPALAEE